ncbi:MAG: LptF/LptG family permease, partial [Desulfobulbaceae bacterium]|nr:LptF/LptG family permease [Desulfobulbaceae bacterium]
KEKIDRGIKEKKFTEALGDLVVYVDRIDEDDKWYGVYVSDMRNRVQPMITIAKSGYMQADIQQMAVTIVLNDGTLHNTDDMDSQIVRFHRYRLLIPLKPPTRIDGDDVTQITRGAMSQQQLLQTAHKYGTDTKQGLVYLSEFHHRLALPVGCFILSLLGMPLGLQAGPGRRAAGIPLGLAFFVSYYITFTLFRVMVEDSVLPVVFGMWLPNIIFAAITFFVFTRVDQERPIVPVMISNFVSDIMDKYCTSHLKRLGRWFRHLVSRRRFAGKGKHRVTPMQTLLVHANSKSNIFHLPGCRQYRCVNCTIEFKSVHVAQEAGFVPCSFCRTLIENNDQ